MYSPSNFEKSIFFILSLEILNKIRMLGSYPGHLLLTFIYLRDSLPILGVAPSVLALSRGSVILRVLLPERVSIRGSANPSTCSFGAHNIWPLPLVIKTIKILKYICLFNVWYMQNQLFLLLFHIQLVL